jgi:hypothetical protein
MTVAAQKLPPEAEFALAGAHIHPAREIPLALLFVSLHAIRTLLLRATDILYAVE